jgi:hypothetical protein
MRAREVMKMRRVKYAASVALITLGTTGLLAERSLALAPGPSRKSADRHGGRNTIAAGSPIQKASIVSPLVAMAGSSLGPKLLARWL